MRGIASGIINGPIKRNDVLNAEKRGEFSIKNVYILKTWRAFKVLKAGMDNSNG